jgi:hypothetical protein
VGKGVLEKDATRLAIQIKQLGKTQLIGQDDSYEQFYGSRWLAYAVERL